MDDPILGYYQAIGGGTHRYWYWVTDGTGRQLTVSDTLGFDATTYIEYGNGGKLAGGTRFSTSFDASRHSNPEMFKLSAFRNRFYDQATGEWTQEDPLGVAGGINLYQFNANNPASNSDPFGLLDTITYNIRGYEIARIKAPGADVHLLRHQGRTYTLDYGMKPGRTPYDMVPAGDVDAMAMELADLVPTGLGRTREDLAKNSWYTGAPLDFKRFLADRTLVDLGGGRMGHKHVVANIAWGYYAAREGHRLADMLRGGGLQGFARGGEDPLDQAMIRRGFNLWVP